MPPHEVSTESYVILTPLLSESNDCSREQLETLVGGKALTGLEGKI